MRACAWLAGVGSLLGIALGIEAIAQDWSMFHRPCKLIVDSQNVATCHLPEYKIRLTCDRRAARHRQYCLTEDGFFAECVSHVVAGDAPMIYCALVESAPAEPGDMSQSESRALTELP
jgi:hypothetical protein